MTWRVAINLVARSAIVALGALLLLALPGASTYGQDNAAFLGRGDEDQWILTADDDDGDDTRSRDGTGNSNDRTGSRRTGVSRDRDRSRGDLTRDRTRDGRGGPRRDWTGGHTNDRTRNDTR